MGTERQSLPMRNMSMGTEGQTLAVRKYEHGNIRIEFSGEEI